MAGFVQIIEFTTTRIDEVRALGDEWREKADGGLALRGTITADRDRPNTYLNIVEFESFETAMENSNRPETTAFAARMTELCDGPAIFRNLDVLDSWTA
ncbi:MAG: hypothetical protein JWP56_2535 [Aeromicrobium sp.]|jgi:hypothetical protein|nr:hypothetical protein [Aeromicrobium sp.]